ncbi:hypothetical protein MMPV_005249 [Pyropia vietnamensis]
MAALASLAASAASATTTTTRLSAPSPTLTLAAAAITAAAGATTPRASAVALYNYVRDTVAFGFTSRFDGAAPEETLATGRGHCTPKGALLAGLLNTVEGVSARQRFVRLDGGVLRGVLGDDPAPVAHSYVEVTIADGGGEGTEEAPAGTCAAPDATTSPLPARPPPRPIRIDGYVVDAPLAAAAAARLAAERRPAGYGIHTAGCSDWDGVSDCFIQMADEDTQVSRDWGAWDEPAAFLDGPNNPQRLPALARALFGIPAALINRRIDALRNGGGG